MENNNVDSTEPVKPETPDTDKPEDVKETSKTEPVKPETVTDSQDNHDSDDHSEEIEELRKQVAQANHEKAMMQLRIDHPDFTEEDIELFGAFDDPEAVKTWGDVLQQVIDRHAKKEEKPSEPDFQGRLVRHLAHSTSAPKPPKQNSKELYNKSFSKYAPSTNRKD